MGWKVFYEVDDEDDIDYGLRFFAGSFATYGEAQSEKEALDHSGYIAVIEPDEEEE